MLEFLIGCALTLLIVGFVRGYKKALNEPDESDNESDEFDYTDEVDDEEYDEEEEMKEDLRLETRFSGFPTDLRNIFVNYAKTIDDSGNETLTPVYPKGSHLAGINDEIDRSDQIADLLNTIDEIFGAFRDGRIDPRPALNAFKEIERLRDRIQMIIIDGAKEPKNPSYGKFSDEELELMEETKKRLMKLNDILENFYNQSKGFVLKYPLKGISFADIIAQKTSVRRFAALIEIERGTFCLCEEYPFIKADSFLPKLDKVLDAFYKTLDNLKIAIGSGGEISCLEVPESWSNRLFKIEDATGCYELYLNMVLKLENEEAKNGLGGENRLIIDNKSYSFLTEIEAQIAARTHELENLEKAIFALLKIDSPLAEDIDLALTAQAYGLGQN